MSAQSELGDPFVALSTVATTMMRVRMCPRVESLPVTKPTIQRSVPLALGTLSADSTMAALTTTLATQLSLMGLPTPTAPLAPPAPPARTRERCMRCLPTRPRPPTPAFLSSRSNRAKWTSIRSAYSAASLLMPRRAPWSGSKASKMSATSQSRAAASSPYSRSRVLMSPTVSLGTRLSTLRGARICLPI